MKRPAFILNPTRFLWGVWLLFPASLKYQVLQCLGLWQCPYRCLGTSKLSSR